MDLRALLSRWARDLAGHDAGKASGNLALARAGLERVLREMEELRVTVRAQIASAAHGETRQRLEAGLRTLESKMADVKTKLEQIGSSEMRLEKARAGAARLKALKEESARLIAEGEALPGGVESDVRARRIRERLSEVEGELRDVEAVLEGLKTRPGN